MLRTWQREKETGIQTRRTQRHRTKTKQKHFRHTKQDKHTGIEAKAEALQTYPSNVDGCRFLPASFSKLSHQRQLHQPTSISIEAKRMIEFLFARYLATM